MAYKICLSNKSELKIDREELETVTKGMEDGARLIKVKSGIFNPSFIVCIEPDYNRLEGLKALDKLPDMFDRIGHMASVEEIAERVRLNSAEEEKPLSKDEMKEKLTRFKPDFIRKDLTER